MAGDIFKILGILLISAILCILLKNRGGEYSLLIALCTGTLTALLILQNLSGPFFELKDKIASFGIETEYFKSAIKALGVGYITSFIADICRDCGQTSLAAKAEFAGKTAIFLISVPLLMSVLEIAVGFVK